MNLDEIFEQIGNSPISLFYGAGVSMDCGGPSGTELLKAMKAEFEGPDVDSFFGYMDKLVHENESNRRRIEAFMRERLMSISSSDEHKYLFSIPWRAVLTTNYDLLPESIGITLDGNRTIMPVADADRLNIDQTRSNLLYCFKLMGDVNYNYPNGGWTVLSSRDLKHSYPRQSKFIELFRNLASSGHIIYLGYSFYDEIVFDILHDMKFLLRQFPWKGFAVTPSKPTPQILERMQQYGIDWVEGNLKDFVEASKTRFGNVPISAHSLVKRFSIHNIPIQLDEATASNIFRKYKILTDSDFESPFNDPRDFFKGFDKTFAPYRNNWDYPRKVKTKRLKTEKDRVAQFKFQNFRELSNSSNSSDNIVIVLRGSAGSGKTVIARRLAFEWYRHGNPVIFVNTKTISLDSQILESLLDEIWSKYREKTESMDQSLKDIRYLLIADDCSGHFRTLVFFRNLLASIGKPADLLLISRKSELSLTDIKKRGVDLVLEVDDTIDRKELQKLKTHFSRFNVLTDDVIVGRNFDDDEINTSFFALIYTSVQGVSKSLSEIIIGEFNDLDSESQRIYAVISLLQHFSLNPCFSVCLKCSDINPEKLLDCIEDGTLTGIVTYNSGPQYRSEPATLFGSEFVENALFTTNRIVADIIFSHALKDIDWLYLTLKEIVLAVKPGDDVEVELLHLLLIDKIRKGSTIHLNDTRKMELFQHAIKGIPSRPLFHHLALLQMHSRNYEGAARNLKEALSASVRGHKERREFVIDSMARLKQMLAKEAISKGKYESAWDLLDEAESLFNEAIITPIDTPHPYQGLGKTYMIKAKLENDDDAKMNYLLLALKICSFVENNSWDEFDRWAPLKDDAIAELKEIGLDTKIADRILAKLGNGDGYAFLADYKIEQNDYRGALKLVERGLKQDSNSLWLIRTKVKITREMHPEDYASLTDALILYVQSSPFRFDISLSFELAMVRFKLGDYEKSLALFNELRSRAKGSPHRLRQLEENRWRENNHPKKFTGIVEKAPKLRKYGDIKCTSLRKYPRTIPLREDDLEFELRGKDKVIFEIIFNMAGPQTSRVRRLE